MLGLPFKAPLKMRIPNDYCTIRILRGNTGTGKSEVPTQKSLVLDFRTACVPDHITTIFILVVTSSMNNGHCITIPGEYTDPNLGSSVYVPLGQNETIFEDLTSYKPGNSPTMSFCNVLCRRRPTFAVSPCSTSSISVLSWWDVFY